jgi:hypothetical protein
MQTTKKKKKDRREEVGRASASVELSELDSATRVDTWVTLLQASKCMGERLRGINMFGFYL